MFENDDMWDDLDKDQTQQTEDAKQEDDVNEGIEDNTTDDVQDSGEPESTEEPEVVDEQDETSSEQQDEENTLSGIELYLSSFDIEGGMISFDDGTSTHFNDLDSEKQAEVLNNLHSSQTSSVEDKYGLDDTEVGLINYLRTNKVTVEEMVNSMVEERIGNANTLRQTESENYQDMSSDAIYLKVLKQSNPEATAEQLETDLEAAKKISNFEKQTEYFRQKFIKDQENLIKENDAKIAAGKTQKLEEDRISIVNEVSKIKDIGGVAINDDVKNTVFDQILEVDEHGDSLFEKQVFSNPTELFNAAFWYQYGNVILKQNNDYWKKEKSNAYKRGREDVLKSGPGKKVSFSSKNTSEDNTKQPLQRGMDSPGSDDSFFLED